jgi:hypothetical protein
VNHHEKADNRSPAVFLRRVRVAFDDSLAMWSEHHVGSFTGRRKTRCLSFFNEQASNLPISYAMTGRGVPRAAYTNVVPASQSRVKHRSKWTTKRSGPSSRFVPSRIGIGLHKEGASRKQRMTQRLSKGQTDTKQTVCAREVAGAKGRNHLRRNLIAVHLRSVPQRGQQFNNN